MTAILQTQTILDQIVAKKQHRILLERKNLSLDELRERFEDFRHRGNLPNVADFAANLHRPKSLGVVAEIKKASPSKGIIQPDFHPDSQALAYAEAGVQAVSVLTEEDFFLGSLQDLNTVRSTISLPILRKDFVIEPGQLYEARLAGASAVLLICALLDDQTLSEYLELAGRLGLSALIEIHDLNELMRALAVGATLIGINNRDLRTFHVDLGATERLAGLIPAGRTIISESGIMSPQDMARVYRAGAHAVLIGETLMRSAGSPASVSQRLAGLFQELPR